MSRADRSRRTPRRTQPTRRRSLTPFVLVGVGAVVVIAAVAAVVIAGGLAPAGIAEPAARPVTITGESLPALTDSAVDPAVGQQLPALAGTGLDGQPLQFGPGDGPMAIVVLAHWCPHCQAELPGLVDLIAQGGVPEGVSVVGVSTGIDAVRPNYPPSAWFEREGWAQPTLIDDASSRALQALGLNAFPGFVFVDAQGAVALRLTGEIGTARFGEILASLAQ
ncbi:MAG: TlpA family protein disulfide reductase [Candidatus Limnocylindria bacterium]